MTGEEAKKLFFDAFLQEKGCKQTSDFTAEAADEGLKIEVTVRLKENESIEFFTKSEGAKSCSSMLTSVKLNHATAEQIEGLGHSYAKSCIREISKAKAAEFRKEDDGTD